MKSRNTNKRSADTVVENELEIAPTPAAFFRNAVVGKYYGRLMKASNLVRLDPKLQKAFPNEQAVNDALWELLRIQERLATLTSDKPKRRKSA